MDHEMVNRPEKIFELASRLLREHYGSLGSAGSPRSWRTLVNIVLGGSTQSIQRVKTNACFEDGPLASSSETSAASVKEIEEALCQTGRARQKAVVLKSLANWWLQRFGNEPEPAVWESDTETLRQELISIRGVSLEMADRLLLFVGDLPVYPVGRASMRIACRHGWMGVESEYEEWQSFFVQGAGRDPAELRAFAFWTVCVGKEHCGPTPRCNACPLESLLPNGGPYEPEG